MESGARPQACGLLCLGRAGFAPLAQLSVWWKPQPAYSREAVHSFCEDQTHTKLNYLRIGYFKKKELDLVWVQILTYALCRKYYAD